MNPASALIVALIVGGATFSPAEPQCSEVVERRTVRGRSMAGLLQEGEVIELVRGYYACREVRREDVVAIADASRTTPIVKVVKAVPGDAITLRQAGQIEVNGRVVVNSFGQPYQLDRRGYALLASYVAAARGRMPESAFLVLGNQLSDSLDSRKFGFIDRSAILGAVRTPPR